MQVVRTEIPDVMIFEPKVHGDSRGFFVETFQADRYVTAGLHRPFVQDNLSRSSGGVLRGLHLQNPRPQGKLVTVLSGEVLDVAVDLRRGSPTFGHHVAVRLNEDNRRQLWIPRGFAHGFVVLSESADFFYKCDDLYIPENEKVIAWDDPDIGIAWGVVAPSLSARDAGGVRLKNIIELPEYGAT